MSDAPRRALTGLSALDRMRGGGQVPGAVPAVAAIAQQAATEPTTDAKAAERPVEPVSVPQSSQKVPTRPKSRAQAPRAVPRPIPGAEGKPDDKMTIYIAPGTRDRAKATYKATAHLEGDASFSAFIVDAITREVERREKLHNDGQQYAGDGGRLTAGRPLS